MELPDLTRRSGEFPVDEIVGRIVDVDRIRKAPSRYGPDQRVQDIVLEDPERRRFAIAVYDLNLRCFSGQCGRGGKEVDFEPRHKGLWIRFRNTAEAGKKPSFRKLNERSKPATHYAKKGVPVVLHATGTASMHWLLDGNQEPPEMRRTDDFKRTQRLHVPGQSPPREERQPPPQEERAPRAQPATKKEPEVSQDPDRLVKRTAWLAATIVKMIAAAYEKAEGITVPKGEQLVSVISTIMIGLQKKLNVHSEEETHLKLCAWQLACLYVKQHQAVLEEVSEDLLPQERLMSLTTTCFIESSHKFQLPRKQSGKRDERSRDCRGDDRGRRDSRDDRRGDDRGRSRDRR